MARDGIPARVLALACVRAAEVQGGHAAILKKGDVDSGVVLVKVLNRTGEAVIYSRARNEADELVWARATGPDPVAEAEADAKLAREQSFDPDIWIVEALADSLDHPLEPADN